MDEVAVKGGWPVAAIEARALSKSFGTRRGTVEAVRGVDLRVEEGEVFGFLGPNGAGKTTTLRMLATLLPPSGGEATVAGRDLLREPARVRERIGYVSQAGGAEASATGRENLVLQARLYGLSKTEALGRAGELAGALELSSFLDRAVRTYSGGQRRRLDLALGMVHRPAVLFLDEPTTGLDPQSRARLWEEVRRLREGGTTVFVTTHYMDEADALCDRVAIIDGGRVAAEGTPAELKRGISGDVVDLSLDERDGAPDRAREVLAGQPFVRELEGEGEGLRLYVDRGEEALPAVLRLLDGAGLGVRGISLSRPTLDDVFLKQTGRSLREAGGTNEAPFQVKEGVR
jgi:ABC-2 type transport system ATP-binding protein